MAEQDQEQKTEPATPKRRQELRQKGSVVQSQDLMSAVLLTAAFSLLTLLGYYVVQGLVDYCRIVFGWGMPLEFTEAFVYSLLILAAKKMLPIVAAVIVSFAAIAILFNYWQVGFKITPDKLKFSIEKLNPLKGIKNLVNLKALMRALFSMGKTAVIIACVYFMIRSEFLLIGQLDRTSLEIILPFLGSLILRTAFTVCGTLLVFGIIDYSYQKWQFEKDIRMTKQEIKDERKQAEGDPAVKKRLMQKRFEMAMQRMMDAVPQATVVVTNPTHYAVALRYKEAEGEAPKVVAKGRDLIAQKIREVANENNVPIVENPPLAQSLYKSVEIDQEIPTTLYRAVAELLSYVYKLRGRL